MIKNLAVYPLGGELRDIRLYFFDYVCGDLRVKSVLRIWWSINVDNGDFFQQLHNCKQYAESIVNGNGASSFHIIVGNDR